MENCLIKCWIYPILKDLIAKGNEAVADWSDVEDQVPEELITEILRFLPVKTLLRFRCISKSLCDLIDSPDFIKSQHLTANSDNRPRGKLIFEVNRTSEHRNPFRIHVFNIDDEHSKLPYGKGQRNYQSLDNHFAHCNGLVLLLENRNDQSHLVLWNPSTRKRRMLSILPTESPTDEFRSSVSAFGFGYDSSSDDYKILLLKKRRVIKHVHVFRNEVLYDYGDDGYEFWIFGLRSCYWRKIENHPNIYFDSLRFYGNCFVDNAFHFFDGSNIFAFDVMKETFSRVSLPFPTNLEDYNPSELQVLQGCLSVIYLPWREKKLDLYVRKKKNVDDGGEFYWTKLFRIPFYEIKYKPFGSDISYLGFPEELGDDGIFVLYDLYVLCTYDFKEKRTKRIVVGDIHKQNVIFCNESLVPIDYHVDEQGKKETNILDQQVSSLDWIEYMEDAKKTNRVEMEEQQRKQEEIRLFEFDAVEEQAFKFMEKFDSTGFWFGMKKRRK